MRKAMIVVYAIMTASVYYWIATPLIERAQQIRDNKVAECSPLYPCASTNEKR